MKNLIYVSLLLLLSCNKDQIPNINNIKDLRIKKITCLPSDPSSSTFTVMPEYNTNGTLKLLKTVFSIAEKDTLIDLITETDNLFKIKFDGADKVGFSAVDPYYDLTFHYTNGRMDSIDYNEKASIPYMGWDVKKMIFEYSGNVIQREYNSYYYQEGIKDEKIFNSVQYNSSGNVVSYVVDSSEFNYEKTEFTYYEPSEWNIQAFNFYLFQTNKKNLSSNLFASSTYFHPIFISKIKFMNNKQNSLIKTVRYYGYYYSDGEKKSYDLTYNMEFKFDDKGRIIEMFNKCEFGYGGKFKIEYLD